MGIAEGQNRLIAIRKAVTVYNQEITDEHDIWELQRELMTEIVGQRKVRVIVIVSTDETEIREADT